MENFIELREVVFKIDSIREKLWAALGMDDTGEDDLMDTCCRLADVCSKMFPKVNFDGPQGDAWFDDFWDEAVPSTTMIDRYS